MLWMTWRQFRAPTQVAVVALAVTAATLALAGMHLTRLYDTSGVPVCQPRGDCGAARQNFLTQVTPVSAITCRCCSAPRWSPSPPSSGSSGARPCSPANWKQAPTGWPGPRASPAPAGSRSTSPSSVSQHDRAGLFSLMVTWSASRIDAASMNWLQPPSSASEASPPSAIPPSPSPSASPQEC